MKYVCTDATLKCTMGTSCPKLKATPKNVSLTGKDQANIADYVSMKNVPSFGRCRSLGYPPTASATVANHGKLTPMPCVPGTCHKWEAIDKDILICSEPALLKPATLKCMYGGTISIVDPGQTLEIKGRGIIYKSDGNNSIYSEQVSNINTQFSNTANSDIPTTSLIKNNKFRKEDNSGIAITNNLAQSSDTKSLKSGGVVTGAASNVTEQNAFYTFMDGVMGVISIIDDILNKPHKEGGVETGSNNGENVNDYLKKRFILCTLNRLFNRVEVAKLKDEDIPKLGIQACYRLRPNFIEAIRATIIVASYIEVLNEKYFQSTYFGTDGTLTLEEINSLGDNCHRIGYSFKAPKAGDIYERYHRIGSHDTVEYAHDGILVREISKGERVPKDLFINEAKVRHYKFKAGDRDNIYLRLEKGKEYYLVAYIYIKGKEGRDGYLFSNVLHLKT